MSDISARMILGTSRLETGVEETVFAKTMAKRTKRVDDNIIIGEYMLPKTMHLYALFPLSG